MIDPSPRNRAETSCAQGWAYVVRVGLAKPPETRWDRKGQRCRPRIGPPLRKSDQAANRSCTTDRSPGETIGEMRPQRTTATGRRPSVRASTCLACARRAERPSQRRSSARAARRAVVGSLGPLYCRVASRLFRRPLLSHTRVSADSAGILLHAIHRRGHAAGWVRGDPAAREDVCAGMGSLRDPTGPRMRRWRSRGGGGARENAAGPPRLERRAA